jgi:hypothetical protein
LRVDGPEKLPVRLDGSTQKDLWPLDVVPVSAPNATLRTCP